jgi:hypothetical protein
VFVFGLSGRRFCAGSGLRVPTFSLVKSVVGSAPAFKKTSGLIKYWFCFLPVLNLTPAFLFVFCFFLIWNRF